MSDFVTEPQVRLVGRPVLDVNGVTEFLDAHDYAWPDMRRKFDSNIDLGDRDAEYLVELGGRTCYTSFRGVGRSHEEHVKHLIEVAHGSCLEHCNFNFELWDISRSLSLELVRHRAGMAFSQTSQRYVDSSAVKFIVPQAILELSKTKPEVLDKWKTFCLQSRDLYEELTTELSSLYEGVDNKTEQRKKSRQAARSVLPNACETKMLVTMNGRAVRHVMEMRGSSGAEVEIRMLAVKILKIMLIEFPLICHGMSVVKLPDGTEGIESRFRKV